MWRRLWESVRNDNVLRDEELHETAVPLYPSGQGEETVTQSLIRAGAVTKTKS